MLWGSKELRVVGNEIHSMLLVALMRQAGSLGRVYGQHASGKIAKAAEQSYVDKRTEGFLREKLRFDIELEKG